MSKKILLFILPILFLIEIMIFGWIAELLRQPSDMAVFIGVVFISAFLIGNYFLIKLIQKTK